MVELVPYLLGCLAIKVSGLIMCCPQVLWLQAKFPQTLVLVFDISLRCFAKAANVTTMPIPTASATVADQEYRYLRSITAWHLGIDPSFPYA